MMVQAGLNVKQDLILKITKANRDGRAAQVVEYLPSKQGLCLEFNPVL
jgi:hypothetical protein